VSFLIARTKKKRLSR